jgi:DNA-binding beta-propeller fold protein YncE
VSATSAHPATSAGSDAIPVVLDSAHVMALANRGAMFVRPRGVALDAVHHEIAVANSGLGRVEFFDYRTWPRGYFTHQVPGRNGVPEPGEPVSLAFTPSGELLVSDLRAPWVDIVDFRGRSQQHLRLPAPDDTCDGLRGPGEVAVAPDGRVFVASRGLGRVHVFDADLRPLASWGVAGRDSGQLSNIMALAVDAEGRVFVACASTELAVQVFDADGTWRLGFGRHDLGPGNFSLPTGIAFAPEGRVCVSDALRHVVQVFDSHGSYVGVVGGPGAGPGEFTEPSALAGDGHGILALAEKSGGRFQVMWLH